MLEYIHVNTENMYDMARSIQACNEALEQNRTALHRATQNLSMPGCSRLKVVQDVVSQVLRQMEDGGDFLDDTRLDLLRRAEFIEEFDRGDWNRGRGWR